MNWQNVREMFPEQWVVFWAIESEIVNETREIYEIAPINGFEDIGDAWRCYSRLHEKDRRQTLFVYHSSNSEIIIKQTNVLPHKAWMYR